MNRIFDAVYGYIELEKHEFDLVNTPIFQRLHWIKQLGPLYTIFPSAQHSRYSHSVGVFHIVKKMMKQLGERKDSYGHAFSPDDLKIVKIAALLHDIGHVPISHVGEEVLSNSVISQVDGKTIDAFDKKKIRGWRDVFPQEEFMGGSTKLHERLSAELVLHSKEIDEVLKDREAWPEKRNRDEAKNRIAQIIVGKLQSDIPTRLLHSELDADRLDYLLRDSFFTGVGYGKIDLDYIISRLVVVKGPKRLPCLCIEHKGLHTAEHYLLGRFFLQTQVIFNRKVRFMDLLFADVMKYMINNQNDKWQLMDLQSFVRNIKGGNSRDDLHELYAFTDAQVFTKMRRLHEELDEIQNPSADEQYINDCIKAIMDGQVPEPAVNHQILVGVDENKSDVYMNMTEFEEEASKKADEIAKGLQIDRKRIKVNVVCQKAMKYTERMNIEGKDDVEINSEAVRFKYENMEGGDEIEYAAKSNATILGGLVDRALLIFNVYYVRDKHEDDTIVKDRQEAIKNGYNDFVSRHFLTTETG